jgi:rubrerythrin
MLEIAPEKVAHVIIKAREYGARVSAWNSTLQEGDAEEDPQAILEDLAHDVTGRELTSFINALNEDEQSHLVALAWIGRGTFEPEELAEAVETARSERINSTARYLLGMPLLADYLEEGLEKMGYAVEDVESDVL